MAWRRSSVTNPRYRQKSHPMWRTPASLCSAIRRGLAAQNPSPLTSHAGVTSLAAIIKKLGEFRKLAAARAATPRCAIDGQAQKLRKSLLSKGTLGRLTSYYVGGGRAPD